MKEYDFVCVGGGLGGLAGAVRARAAGLEVLVIEKTQYVGGVAAYSGGDIWAPLNHLQPAAGLGDSREAALDYMAYVGGAGVPYSAAVREMYVDRIGEAISFYAEYGSLNFQLTGLCDSFFPVAPGSVPRGRSTECSIYGDELGERLDQLRPEPYHRTLLRWSETLPESSVVAETDLENRRHRHFLVRGRGLVGALFKAAVDAGVDIMLEAPAVGLLYDGVRVRGVSARINGEVVDITARRGVLLATGGYGYAPYAAEMEGLPEFAEQAPPIVEGDALKLIEPTPAATVRAGFGYVALGYRSATHVHPGTDVLLTHPVVGMHSPHCIAVNPDGERFGDESSYLTFTALISAYDGVKKKYKNFPTYAILDDQYRRKGFDFGLGSDGEWPEESLVRAESLEELATGLGIDPGRLTETVKRFNEFCHRGSDDDFHRGEAPSQFSHEEDRIGATLGTIEEPPFWGCRLTFAGAGICSHGLEIGANASVVDRAGQPITGLYATGNAVAYIELPGGYSGGVANGRNLTYAYVAATHAAAP